MRKKLFRTKYLTGSRIQMRYLALLMLSMIIPTVFVAGCLYYLIFTIMAEQIGIPEYIAYNVFPVIDKINTILIIGVLPLFALLSIWGVVASHRFAGPLERLEEEINKISEHGDYTKRIRLRKSDDTKPIADAVNNLMDRIEGRK